jgi:hypothetical protein
VFEGDEVMMEVIEILTAVMVYPVVSSPHETQAAFGQTEST